MPLSVKSTVFESIVFRPLECEEENQPAAAARTRSTNAARSRERRAVAERSTEEIERFWTLVDDGLELSLRPGKRERRVLGNI